LKTEDILNEREKTHGDFGAVSRAWCGLTTEFDGHYQASDVVLNDVQASAIKMILLKISRIICGDPNFADHWDDIKGYAELGKGETKEAPCKVCSISIECFGVPCDGHLQAHCDELREIKKAEEPTITKDEQSCLICSDNIGLDDYRYKWDFEGKYLCRHCLVRLKEVTGKTESEENSTSSKMEHAQEEWFDAEKVKMPFDALICLEILHSDGRKSITLPIKQGYDGTCTMYNYDINGNKNEYEVYFIGSVIRWKYA